MRVLDIVLGRPLASAEARAEQIGPAAGIPIFGLDALSSAAYGPEAALTLLIPLGAAGISLIVPITGSIIVLLLIVYFSYRQTIEAYPGGGGSYTNGSGVTLGYVAYYIHPQTLHPRDFRGLGRSDVLLYDPPTGTAYAGLSNANGTFAYVYNLITSNFNVLRAASNPQSHQPQSSQFKPTAHNFFLCRNFLSPHIHPAS